VRPGTPNHRAKIEGSRFAGQAQVFSVTAFHGWNSAMESLGGVRLPARDTVGRHRRLQPSGCPGPCLGAVGLRAATADRGPAVSPLSINIGTQLFPKSGTPGDGRRGFFFANATIFPKKRAGRPGQPAPTVAKL
jgi:hypothetical protein